MKSSYSKIGSFSFCAKKYEYRYVLDMPAPQKPELAFGIALHSALEQNFRQKIETRKDLPLNELLEFFRCELDEGLSKVPDENLRGPSDTNYLRSIGEHFLGRFIEDRAPKLQPAPRGVECFFNLPVPGGHEITGKFDLLDNEWVLHDFKTSNKPYDPRKADKTQLIIYAWACEKIFGRQPKALCFDVFVKGDGADGDVQMQAPVMFPVPNASEIARVAFKLKAQLEKIMEIQASGIFPRAFEPLRCHWCEYQSVCVDEWEKTGKSLPMRISLEALV